MLQLSLGIMSRTGKRTNTGSRSIRCTWHASMADLGARIYLEHGYGETVRHLDERLTANVAGLRSPRQLIAECDVILLAQTVVPGLADLREGQILWGWRTACRTRNSPNWPRRETDADRLRWR